MNIKERIEIINSWNLNKVFNELENGNMRIPRFQRAYVWERSKIVALLNSIYQQYPIGSFFLWDTDTQMESFCRDITEFGFPKKPEANKFTFILDGQQRITSLYVTLKGKTLKDVDYRTICFNLDKKVFKIPTLKTELHNIPVWKIYNEEECQKIIREYYKNGQFDYGDALSNCRLALNNYPVSIIKSMNMELDEVVTIFERINQGGKRLSLFDLVHASVWSKDFDLRDRIAIFNSDPKIKIFGWIDYEIFTQSLALNIRNDCTNKNQLKLTCEECKNCWERTDNCIRLSIDFIKQYGVQSASIIPYQNILPVLQHYFFVSGNNYIDAIHKELISDWFWSLTFSQRYSSSSLTRMNEDALWIRSLLEGDNTPKVFTVKLNVGDLKRIRMNNKSVIKNGILCLMAMNSPRDFDNNDIVTLDNTNASQANSKENHHFFPYSFKQTFGITDSEINCVLNFAFISKRLNNEISNKKPSIYLVDYENKNDKIIDSMASHFISFDAFNAAKTNNFYKFIEDRGKIILQYINNVCKVSSQSIGENVTESIYFEDVEQDSYDDFSEQ